MSLINDTMFGNANVAGISSDIPIANATLSTEVDLTGQTQVGAIIANIESTTNTYNAILTTEVNSGDDGGALQRHINDHNNPHQVTSQQVGAVPLSLRDIAAIQEATLSQKTLRELAQLYVDNNGTQNTVSLQQIKEMNTLIVDNPTTEQLGNLSGNDYILT